LLTNLQKTPFTYFGGKSDAAPAVWAALGDVAHYVEPFMGSLAVLLRPQLHMLEQEYASAWKWPKASPPEESS
jgi:site-specific DNA-adenine methylase